ncbi:MAG: OmpW family outer membrane protein [Acidobacteriota bacterium]
MPFSRTFTRSALVLITSATILGAAPSAHGARTYLKLVAGFGDLDDGGTLEVNDPRFSSSADASYDLGLRSGLAFGWNLDDRFALELEYLYSTNDFDTVVFSDGERFEEGNYASVVISANAYTFFRRDQNVRPYLGAGLAWVQEVDIDFERDGAETSFETDDFGFQVMAGVLWDLNDRWALDLQARFLAADGVEMEAEEGSGTVRADYRPLSLFAGLSYRF